MELYLYALLVVVFLLGVAIPEIWKRKKLAELESREKGSEVSVAIERLHYRLVASMWQMETTFFVALVAILVTLIR